MDWLKFFVLALTESFAIYEYAIVTRPPLLERTPPDLAERKIRHPVSTLFYVILLGTDVFAAVLYALRFQSGGLANTIAWAAVFSLGVCLAIAIGWIVPFSESAAMEGLQNIPVPPEKAFRVVHVVSAVLFLLGFVSLSASTAAYS